MTTLGYGDVLPASASAQVVASIQVVIGYFLVGGLLFIGAERGVHVTVDGGAHWHRLSGGMPTIAVRDLAVQRRDGLHKAQGSRTRRTEKGQ